MNWIPASENATGPFLHIDRTPPTSWGTWDMGRKPPRRLSRPERCRLWLARRLLGLAARVWPTGYPWGEA